MVVGTVGAGKSSLLAALLGELLLTKVRVRRRFFWPQHACCLALDML